MKRNEFLELLAAMLSVAATILFFARLLRAFRSARVGVRTVRGLVSSFASR